MNSEGFMALAAAESLGGHPSPNPRVGCVIVSGGEIVGRGFHARAGGPHAEIVALREAGDRARGATVFVTLEPCNHTGRTPPCSLALIEAGVARVVYANADPNPIAQGGAERLRAAGIDCYSCSTEESEDPNYAWLTAMQRRRPYVTLKAGISLDGRIALPDGSSRWITGEDARVSGHYLRAERGAVLFGRRTVEADDPHGTARLPEPLQGGEPPWRIVLDPHDRLAPDRRIFDAAARTIRYVTSPSRPGDRAWPGDLKGVLDDLFSLGRTGLLVEGGGRTHGGFLREGLADEIVLFVSPKILGEGPSWVEGTFPDPLASAKYVLHEMDKMGEDVRLVYRLRA